MNNTTDNFSLTHWLAGIFCCVILFSSCNEDWNKYYVTNQSGLQKENLYDLIRKDDALSKFKQLVEISGYSEILSASQTFTVWAPENGALGSIDLTDTALVRQTVANHISRFNYSTSTPAGQLVRMISGKVYCFSDDSGISFGGCRLITNDKQAKNGILHTINQAIVYTENIYEYINNQPNTSELFRFVKAWEMERITGEGDDQVRSFYNPLFLDKIYGLGNLFSEDSIFTMLVPTNAAWNAAYDRISTYFNVYNKNQDVADSIKKVQTSLAILSDLIYRGKITEPGQYSSIVSTSGSIINNVENLFQGATLIPVSNGIVYLTDEIRYNNTETWNKAIPVECENQLGRTTGENTIIYTRVVDENSIIKDVSNKRYIEVQPKNTTAQPSVTFDIPDVLSGKYDIYAEFIPAIIEGENHQNDSTKLNFTLRYLATDGSLQTATSNNHLTSGREKSRIKIFEAFAFPVSDYYDRLWLMDKNNYIQNIVASTKLEIKTNVSVIEFNTNRFTRKFRVDRIVFEPVPN